jgi:hypothetical protein
LITLAAGAARRRPRGQPADVEDAGQVDLDHLPQVAQGLLIEWSVVANAGVVDQHVEPAVPARELAEMLPVRRVGDVAGERFDPGPALLRQLAEKVGAASGGDDVRAGRMQHPGESCSQAA